MDFIIVANAWGAGIDNPTSKHRIALELARQGHRVLWVEGAGMRAPSVGSGPDRVRMIRKVIAACRGARQAGVQGSGFRVQGPEGAPHQPSTINHELGTTNHEPGSAGIWVLSPLFVPAPKWPWVRWLNGVIGAWSARLWCTFLGFRQPVLINYVPVLAEVMRRWRRRVQGSQGRRQGSDSGARTTTNCEPGTANLEQQTKNQELRTKNPFVIYHCVDRWDAFKMYDSAVMAEMDRRCCRYADLVVASSSELYARCRQLNPNTHLVTHGVDHEHFARALAIRREEEAVPSAGNGLVELAPPGDRNDSGFWRRAELLRRRESGEAQAETDLARPDDLPAGPIVGFFGLLSEWIDQDLLVRLARELPAVRVILIGKADVPVTALQGLPNVALLGPRPFQELPRYLAWFDVGIIPFVVNDLTRSVNPIKLREMLSAGCPVVSTALPEVEVFDGQCGVSIGRTAEEFVSRVKDWLACPATTEARQEISRSMADETWEAKVACILKLCGCRPCCASDQCGLGREVARRNEA